VSRRRAAPSNIWLEKRCLTAIRRRPGRLGATCRWAAFVFLLVCVPPLAAGAAVIMGLADGGNAAPHERFKCSVGGSSATTRVPVTGLRRNGSNDDSGAIQAAIDRAGQDRGGIVALPAGTFVINKSLVLQSNVELTGVGPATVVKAGPGLLSAEGPGGGYPLITTAGAADVTVAHLTADQSGDTLDGNVPGRLTGYVVEGRYSRNVLVDGIFVRNPFTYSIAMVQTTGFCIEDCAVRADADPKYDQLDGIHILDSSEGQVIYNTVRSGDDGLVAHTIGAPTHDILYGGNEVYGGKLADGMQLAVGDFPIYRIRILDNNFSGSLFGVRTGYYDSRTGAVYDIFISGNYIHDLTRRQESPAVAIGGFGGLGSVENVTVENNRTQNAGMMTVHLGSGKALG
jgi:polygalacturonase